MAAPSARPTWRRSTIAILLVLAIVAGVGASLLVGRVTPPSPRAGELIVELPPSVWGLLFLSPLLAAALGIAVQRALSDGVVPRRKLLVQALLFIAIVLLLVWILQRATPGSGVVQYSSPFSGAANNTTTHPSNGTGSSPSGPNGTAPPTQIYTLSLPSWSLDAFVVAVVATVGVLAVPGMIARLVDRRRRGPPPPPFDRAKVAASFTEALEAIQRGEDAREVIVRLYVALLPTLVPKVGDVEPLTATEIRDRLVSDLGLPPQATDVLTHLFEEARYSTHALGPTAADRCREAIVSVEAGLQRDVPAA